jgi:hypothetical protein
MSRQYDIPHVIPVTSWRIHDEFKGLWCAPSDVHPQPPPFALPQEFAIRLKARRQSGENSFRSHDLQRELSRHLEAAEIQQQGFRLFFDG